MSRKFVLYGIAPLLCAVAAAAFVGCTSPTPTPSGKFVTNLSTVEPSAREPRDPQPVALIANDPSELNFAINDFPPGWQMESQGEEDGGYQVRAVKLGTIVPLPENIVAAWIKVFPSIKAASESYKGHHQQKSESFRLDDPKIAEESLIYQGNATDEVYFRTVNVLARVTMFTQYGGSLSEVKRWADILEIKIDEVKHPADALTFAEAPPVKTPGESATPALASLLTPSPAGPARPVPTPTPTPATLPAPNLLPKNVFVLAENMAQARTNHAAVRLADGRVLVAGGSDGTERSLDSSEIFDPTKGRWSEAANLGTARDDFTMTLLADGRVLATGGQNDGRELGTAEIYDPISDTWRAAGKLTLLRTHHSATLLTNGQVLLVGGYAYDPATNRAEAVEQSNTAEIFDSALNTFYPAGKLNYGRVHHSTGLLPSGKVLVVGGLAENAYTTAEIFDPSTGSFSLTGKPIHGRRNTALTVLEDGIAFVRGGFGDQSGSSAEEFDPRRGSFELISNLVGIQMRYNHVAVSLEDGKVLITGGTSGFDVLESGGYLAHLGFFYGASVGHNHHEIVEDFVNQFLKFL